MKDTFTVLVEQGAELPQIGKKLYTSSYITDRQYEIKISKIVGLRWNKNNQLIVEVEGVRNQVVDL